MNRPAQTPLLLLAFLVASAGGSPGEENQRSIPVGVAKVDITPAYPIRLSGYAVRKKESEGVAQHLYAKALALGSDQDGPAILLTVDNTGVPAAIRNEVVRRLQQTKGLDPDRIALCSSHSHAAPCLAGNLPTLFGEPLPPEHQAHVDQYTRELVDALEAVALASLNDRAPARLAWGQGQAEFASNRRTAGGPVDHDLPLLAVEDPNGRLRALFVNYACHCTTLGGNSNQVCGDWAGYAQEYLERDHPGAVVLAAIGCGADANPQPAGSLGLAQRHGQEVATAVNAVLGRTMVPLRGPPVCRVKAIELPFDTLPTREAWERLATQTNYAGYYARVNLAKLDRGEKLPTRLPYQISTWNFGDDLAMVFLPGEVVVDYALRLKKEFDRSRLWVNAYANDVPCYIPSERILTEGGYEGGGAMVYYDKPTRLAPGIESLIVDAVHDLLPPGFIFDEKRAEFPPPKSAAESLAAMQIRAGFEVELVAAEPLIVDPVAIDWGPDGKLWVVEMRDYPMGMDGRWKPGSRIKLLEASQGVGKYDKATVFLDDLPFATGVTAWRKGALICAAPDILYAEDTDGDGRADLVEKVFTGFATDNYQARVNSLSLGLDNWLYGANGLIGGVIHSVQSSLSLVPPPSTEVDIRGRDFRFRPDSGVFEPVSGLTQQGRVRDDWGHWFGCDNSVLVWHYPIPDHYLRRNPHVTAPSPRVAIAAGADANLLHPASRTLERFNQPQAANRVTSACGLGLYRDVLLGDEFYGNAFVCEPVHNLVHRLLLKPSDVTFSGLRPPGEETSEFLASRDNWFRPVQVRTGPDGALWVVDMYRFVIEHPRWIPPDRLAKLDVRAGQDMGRIYRVFPAGARLRPIPDLTRLSSLALAAALDTPNGTERDRIHQELIRRLEPSVIGPLEALATRSQLPAVRVQALCILDGIGALKSGLVIRSLGDPNPDVRAQAIRLCEKFLSLPDQSPAELGLLLNSLAKLATDSDPSVRLQLALTLGVRPGPRAGALLGELASNDLANQPWFRAAILSSAPDQSAFILKSALAADPEKPGRSALINQLIATVVGEADPDSLPRAINAITQATSDERAEWQLAALASFVEALDRRNISLATLAVSDRPELREAAAGLQPVFDRARVVAVSPETGDSNREPAIRLLGHDPRNQTQDLQSLAGLLKGSLSPRSQQAVLDALKRLRGPETAKALLADWNLRLPSLRQASLAVLLSREEWIEPLLAAMEQGTVARAEISIADRQRLLHHSNLTIQHRAQAQWPTNATGDRAEIVARFQSATTLAGDPARGALTFGKTCAACHALRGQGHAVGRNLAPLADKTPADFLLAILDPNAVVEPRFLAYNLETKDGRSLSGIVSAETATTLTLVQAGGIQENILRSDLREIRAAGLSLMPEGLEQNLTAQELADLIAYLKTSPKNFGSASPQQAQAAKTQFLAGGANGLGQLIAAMDQIPYPSWIGTLPMPYCRQTDGQGRLEWRTQPVPADLNKNGPYEFRLPAAMGLVSDPSGKFTLRLNGKPVLDFDVALTDQSWQSRDGKVRMTYTVLENNTEDSNGVLVISAAADLLDLGEPATFMVVGSAAKSERWFGVYLTENAGAW